MRYLARTSKSPLYNDEDENIAEIDARLDTFSKALCSVDRLANHLRGTC